MSGTHEMQIEGHRLVALAINPDTPGQPVILLHGIASSVNFWIPDLVCPFLERGPCYALSLPGHYPAAFPPGFSENGLTAEMMACVLADGIRELVNSQPVMLVGHSTGGFAALAIAASHPEIARQVISISGFVQGKWTGALGMYQRLARRGLVGRAVFLVLSAISAGSPAAFRRVWHGLVADRRALHAYPHLKTLLRDTYPDARQLDPGAMYKYASVMPDIDIGDLLPHINAPTLALTGDCDPIVPPEQSRQIADRVPDAVLAVIPGAGHLPFIERPSDYRRALDNWLHKTEER